MMNEPPLTPPQVRAARALLAWSQNDLARNARVGSSTVADFERGQRTPVANNAEAIRTALEAAGVSFLPGGAVIGPAPPMRRATNPGGTPIRWVNATDLSQWADRRIAQGSMPELLTRLIRAATGLAARLEFPADESVQFAGWDGTCEVDVGTEHIPGGSSAWEIGTQRTKIIEKADADYEKRSTEPLGLVTRNSTFVFVTPRRWSQKRRWVAAKRAERKWSDVRAYDADDLVHWIELYPAVGNWLAVALGKRPEGVQQLEEAWEEWSLSTQVPLSAELTLAGRDEEAAQILRWLRDDPAIFSLQAESVDEAIAFLYAAICELPEPYRTEHSARSLIVGDAEAARAIGDSLSPVVIVLEDAEPGLARRLAARGHHVFIAHGPGGGPHDGMQLSRPPWDAVEHTLATMGVEGDRARNLARDSARSLAVLRRLIPAAPTRVPVWAKENVSRTLIAALLAGAWDESVDGDKAALERLAGKEYEAIASELAPLVGFLERPLRKAGTGWKVASPRDAWFRLAERISPTDFDRFGAVAHDVLASRDPRFDMEPDERWLAATKGIRPEYSEYLRRGLGETLILFSLYSRHVPCVSNAAIGVENLVRRLLGNADQDRWWSLSREYQLLAEAAPDVFLAVLDDALHRDTAVDVLFSEDGGFSGGTYLADLLWALESLAWSSQYLSRVVAILATLTRRDPGGHYGNRPENSLRGIFLVWYPQTSANLAARLRVLDQLRKTHPDVAWKLMLGILPRGHDTASPGSHTRWRDLSVDREEQITYGLIAKGGDEVAQRLLAEVGSQIDRWCDLIAAFPNLLPERRAIALDQLSIIAPGIDEDDEARARISGALRHLLHRHRQFPDADWSLLETELTRAEVLYHAMQPKDVIKRSAWLFAPGVDLPEPTVKIANGQHVADGWKADQEEASGQRRAAIAEIVEKLGSEGVLALADVAESPESVGRALADLEGSENAKDSVLKQTLPGPTSRDEAVAHGMIVAALTRGDNGWVAEVLMRTISERWGDEATYRMLRALPENSATWNLAAAAGKSVDDLYWGRRSVLWIDASDENLTYAVGRLITAGRARHAVQLVGHCGLKRLPASFLVRILAEAAKEPWIKADQNDAGMFRHYVVEMFKELDQAGVPDEQIVVLEWAYLPLFRFSDRPPRTLHKALATEPGFFIEVLRQVYRPSPESGIQEPDAEHTERNRAIWAQAFELLREWKHVPGATQHGTLDPAALEDWVRAARIQAAQVGRAEVADSQIGQVLSHAPPEADGIWPAIPIRELIEITRSQHLENGISVGIHNKRGATWRAMNDGGAQERNLAIYYRKCSKSAALEWPRTSALLEQIAKSYEWEGNRHDEDAERREW
jgi:transcriptional regulator with XRE-family HTH domain